MVTIIPLVDVLCLWRGPNLPLTFAAFPVPLVVTGDGRHAGHY